MDDETSDTNKIAKAIIIDDNEKFLIMRTSMHQTFIGQWDLPGGHIMINENIVDGLIREVYEETSLIIINPMELYKKQKITFFMIDMPKGQIKLSDEHDKYELISFDEINNYEISDKFKEAIRRAYG